jgi:hypothetical protein
MEPLSLTDEMKNILKKCYQLELNGKEPCSPATDGFADELLLQGLVILKPHTYYNKERKAAYFITDKGREILKKIRQG